MAVVTPAPLPVPIDVYAKRPTERLFDNGVIGAYGAAPDTGDENDAYAFRVRALIDDSCDFEESILAPAREENLEYFFGETPGVEGEGTSTAVSTDFRDTVMAIIPSLIRIFTAEENPISCTPNYEGQEDAAKQTADYLSYMFYEDNPGFLILHDLIKDALRCNIGVCKWWTEDSQEVVQQMFRNISQAQLQAMIFENPTLEVVDIKPPSSPDMVDEEGQPLASEVTVRFSKSKPVTKIEAVPLDEFRIDRTAKTIPTSRLTGHDRITEVGELIAAGYDPAQLEPFLGASSTYSTDRQYRNEGIDETSVDGDQMIRYGCYYIRIDKDGDGIPELREIHTVGDQHFIIKDEAVQYVNYAVWCPDPEPHTLVGDSPAELVKDIQRIKTNMLRGALDSLAQSIWPRTVFNETLVSADDVLNDEIGAAIRTKGNPMDTVQSLTHTFVGQPVFQMFEVMEVLRQQRTGINDASKGLDPKALQSVALQGVDAIVSGAQERIELIARILAETGLKDLFTGLLRECVNNPNPKRTIQLRGKWVKIEPSTFDPNMKMRVNPTLGKGSETTRLLALQDIRGTQQMVMEKFGVDNPLCGVEEFRNTLVDMLAIANIKNPDRYFKVITPEIMQQIREAPKEPDPALLLAQAEMEKTRSKTASEIAKTDLNYTKLMMDDDFRRDELRINGILDAAKIEADSEYDVNDMEIEAANTAIDFADLAASQQNAEMDRANENMNAEADRAVAV